MPRDLDAVLYDIDAAIEGVIAAVAGIDFASFQGSWITRHAVQRGIEIISEASRHLPDNLVANITDIPWRDIRAIGNVIRHTYFRVSDEMIWRIAKDDLPKLKAALAGAKSG